MSFQKFKNDSFCVGCRHRSGAKNKVGEKTKTFDIKTDEEIRLFFGKCVVSDKRKSMIVSDNLIQAEGLGDFFKNLGRKGLKISKRWQKNVLSNPGRGLDLTAKIATAAASKNYKQALSTLPESITFYNTGKCLYLGNLVYIMLYKWNRRQIDCTHLHH